LRVNGNPANLDQLFARYRVGDAVTLHAFRRDELMQFDVTLQGCVAPVISIGVATGARRAAAVQRPSAS
jgi:predicted metalloprotease with PDZ domain